MKLTNERSILESETEQLKKLLGGTHESKLDAMNTFKVKTEDLCEQFNQYSKGLFSKLNNLENKVNRLETLKQEYIESKREKWELQNLLVKQNEQQMNERTKITELARVNREYLESHRLEIEKKNTKIQELGRCIEEMQENSTKSNEQILEMTEALNSAQRNTELMEVAEKLSLESKIQLHLQSLNSAKEVINEKNETIGNLESSSSIYRKTIELEITELHSCIATLEQEKQVAQATIESTKTELKQYIEKLTNSFEFEFTRIESALSFCINSVLCVLSSSQAHITTLGFRSTERLLMVTEDLLSCLYKTDASLILALLTLKGAAPSLGPHFLTSLPEPLKSMLNSMAPAHQLKLLVCTTSQCESISEFSPFTFPEDLSRLNESSAESTQRQISDLKQHVKELETELLKRQKSGSEEVNLEHLNGVLGSLLRTVPRLTEDGENMVNILLSMLRFSKAQVRDIERVRIAAGKSKSTLLSIFGI